MALKSTPTLPHHPCGRLGAEPFPASWAAAGQTDSSAANTAMVKIRCIEPS